MGVAATALKGLDYEPGFCSPGEADALLEWARGLDYSHVAYGPKRRGETAPLSRGYIQYGVAYSRTGQRLDEAPPVPERLVPVIARAQQRSGFVFPASYCVVMHYPAGAGLDWHVDGNRFRDVLLIVSLGAPADVEFRPKGSEGQGQVLHLEHGSLYAMHGPARWDCEHRVQPVAGERYCLQFRDVDPNAGRKPAGAGTS
jgi:alkylated DNA repair dioxygenase AlkB